MFPVRLEVVQGELHHDGRDHAEKHRGNKEDGRREQQDPQHQGRLELGGADQIGQGRDGQGPHAGQEEQPPQGCRAGIAVREGPADPGADADPGKDDADDARPRVQGDPHVGRHDPSRHEFDDERAETGDENDDVGLDDNRIHNYLFTLLPSVRIVFSIISCAQLSLREAKRRGNLGKDLNVDCHASPGSVA